MKKIHLILFTVFLNIGFYSCTPTSEPDNTQEPIACCGNGRDIRPS